MDRSFHPLSSPPLLSTALALLLAAVALLGCRPSRSAETGLSGQADRSTPRASITSDLPTASPQASPWPRPSPSASPALTRTLVASGFSQPLLFLEPWGVQGRRFVVEKAGVVKTAEGGSTAAWRVWLDLRDRVGDEASEQGLLGLAFHPRFATNGRFFVDYTDENGDTVVSELREGRGEAAPEPASERVLLRIAQPASNHNGGHLAFGPDGYLYIASGDGGGSGGEAAQDPGSRLGKLLRIDVDRRGAGRAYGIPADNPWAREDGPAAEIWALGLRNPWRFSFDSATGDLAIGDVGGSAWEEIDREVWSATGGRNYGWPRWEGFEERREKVDLAPRSPREEPPVLVYPHEDGDCAVTGGQVYRGRDLPWLRGVYVFADYCSGRLWAALPDAARRGRWRRQLLLDSGLSVAHVGADGAGELILCDLTGGGIHRLGPADTRAP